MDVGEPLVEATSAASKAEGGNMSSKLGNLPQFQNDDKDFQLMQNSWGAILSPLLRSLPNNSSILSNVSLLAGDNTVNTLLGRKLTGWSIIRKRAAADIYDKQDSNLTPQLTLVLNSSAPVVVDLEIF